MKRIRQNGAALVVGLVFLLILTVLSVSGMKMARIDIVMAGYEQFYAQALHGAEAAVDAQIADNAFQVDVPPGQNPVDADLPAGISGQSTYDYVNQGMAPDGGFSDDVLSYRYVINADGAAPPGDAAKARVRIRQGLYIIAPGG